MRTTIRLNDELLRRAKRLAAQSGRSLTRLIEDSLRESIVRSQTPAARGKKVRLHTAPGKPRPGIDLDDSASLLDQMDDARA